MTPTPIPPAARPGRHGAGPAGRGCPRPAASPPRAGRQRRRDAPLSEAGPGAARGARRVEGRARARLRESLDGTPPPLHRPRP
ncbi:hypothetical protein [Kocuria sp. KH4]